MNTAAVNYNNECSKLNTAIAIIIIYFAPSRLSLLNPASHFPFEKLEPEKSYLPAFFCSTHSLISPSLELP